MQNRKIDIHTLSSDKLMTTFTRSPIVLWTIVAFAFHIVVIGGMSMDDIHAMIDPVWGEQQAKIREDAKKALLDKKIAEAAAKHPKTTQPATKPSSRPASQPASQATSKPMTGREKIEKMISTPASPNEIPKAPPGAGIGIDDVEK